MGKALRPLLLLHSDPVLREQIRKIAPETYSVRCFDSWENLADSMRKTPAHALVLVDPYHVRGWQQTGIAPELKQLLRGFPSATVVAALASRRGWIQDVLDLGERGVAGVIELPSTEKTVKQYLAEAPGRQLHALQERGQVAPGRGWSIVNAAVETAADSEGVRDLACKLGVSKPTLLRWCAGYQLPTPRRLLIWLRVLIAAEVLDDLGRSVLDVALSCGYSSDRALRRALQSTVRKSPSELRQRGAFQTVAAAFRERRARTPGPPPAGPPPPPESPDGGDPG